MSSALPESKSLAFLAGACIGATVAVAAAWSLSSFYTRGRTPARGAPSTASERRSAPRRAVPE